MYRKLKLSYYRWRWHRKLDAMYSAMERGNYALARKYIIEAKYYHKKAGVTLLRPRSFLPI